MSEPVMGPSDNPGRRAKLPPLKEFGRVTGKHVRQDLLRRVHAGSVRYARKLSRSRTVIVLDYAGEELAFLYSNSTRRILCFLSPGAPETEDWRHSQEAARALFHRPPGHHTPGGQS